MAMRVQKYLSKAGYCSRREGESLMRQGRVQVNGEICRELGSKVAPESDTVEVDGRPIALPDEFTYLAIHKPEGYLTTLDDPQGRRTIVELLPDDAPRLWPVGRLDADSSGLLLMTNDGKLTHRLTHPSYEARKHYEVEVEGHLSEGSDAIEQLRNGVELDDEYVTEPAEVEILEKRQESRLLAITLTEGKNRQIRRMADAIGHPVRQLRRVAVGPIALDDLEPGDWRRLSDEEVHELYGEVDTEPARRAP